MRAASRALRERAAINEAARRVQYARLHEACHAYMMVASSPSLPAAEEMCYRAEVRSPPPRAATPPQSYVDDGVAAFAPPVTRPVTLLLQTPFTFSPVKRRFFCHCHFFISV